MASGVFMSGAFEEQAWEPVVDSGNGRYRATLVDNYLCGFFAYATGRSKILNKMNDLKPYKKKDWENPK